MRRVMLLVLVAGSPAVSRGQHCRAPDDGFGLFLDAYAGVGETAGVAAGDLDGDGLPDVASTLRHSGKLVVFLGRHGAFALADYVPLSRPGGSIRLADLDRDGDLDAAAATTSGVALLWNDGLGVLGDEGLALLGRGERTLRAGDLTGDGLEDLVALERSDGSLPASIAVIVNEGTRRFAPARNYFAGEGGVALDIADLDGDGDADAAVLDSIPSVRILENDGGGRFPRSRTIALSVSTPTNDLVAGAFDSEAGADICVASGGEVNVLLQRGGSEFLGLDAPGSGSILQQLVPGDLDGDGSLDLVVLGAGHVLLNDGSGTLSARRLHPDPARDGRQDGPPVAPGLHGSSGCAADLEGDGDLDVVVAGGNGLTSYANREASPPIDCNLNGTPDWCETDCNRNGTPDDCDVLSGVSGDCNGNGVPDPCETDCDRNGSPDACDIAEGRATDCNGNRVPDPCEPPPGDCNGNGIPDVCDMARGAAGDCNANGVPDECELEVRFGLRGQLSSRYPRMSFALASDLDGSGAVDVLAVVSEVPDQILGVFRYVMLFRDPARYGFESGTVLGQGQGPVDAGDIDLDGDVDLCMVRRDELAVLAQSEEGRFEERTTLRLPAVSHGLALAAFDDDPAPDVCVSGYGLGLGGTWLLRGSGDGSFRDPEIVSGALGALEAADLDADGRSDLVVDGLSAVVLRSTVSGRYIDAGALETGWGGIALGDFDRDGSMDLASGGGYLYRNDGSAAFTPKARLGGDDRERRGESRSVAAGDIEGDGDLDIILLDSSSRVSLHRNDGAWSFETLEGSNVPEHTWDIHGEDIDGDGVTDIITDGLRILLNLGEPQAYGRRVVFFEEGFPGTALASLDLEGDGDRDLVTVHPGFLALHRNRGDGSFATGGEIGTGAHVMAAADLDGDADLDFALGSSTSPLLQVFWNEGGSSLRAGAELARGQAISALLASDFDGRGGLDIAAWALGGDELALFLHEGGQSFAAMDTVGFAVPGVLLASLDADADGDVDLTVGRAAGTERNTVSFLLNDGQAHFEEGGSFPVGGRPIAAAAGDLNGDGRADLVVSFEESGSCQPASACLTGGTSLFLSTGDGKFRESGKESSPRVSGSILAADLDLDGDLDLGLPWTWSRAGFTFLPGQSVEVSLNDGSGAFSHAASLLVGTGPEAVAADDFDGDGLPDLATVSTSDLSLAYSRRSRPGEDREGDAVPDDCSRARFRRGDTDANGAVDLTDAVHLLLHLFQGGVEPGCAKAADANDDGRVDISDPVSILDHLFRGGPAPPQPHESCGLDASPDALPCEAHAPCA